MNMCIECGKQLTNKEYMYCFDCLNKWLNKKRLKMKEIDQIKEKINEIIDSINILKKFLSDSFNEYDKEIESIFLTKL